MKKEYLVEIEVYKSKSEFGMNNPRTTKIYVKAKTAKEAKEEAVNFRDVDVIWADNPRILKIRRIK